jgi:KaiB domain
LGESCRRFGGGAQEGVAARPAHSITRVEIVALPTVVREAPVPIRKTVGDLSGNPRVLFALQF